MPPICTLLIREADAWRALLGLHTSVVGAAQQISRSEGNAIEATIFHDEKNMNSETREAAYCGALSSLASQCDALYTEVLKLRTLRKARRSVEVQCAQDVVRAHSDEILAIGQTLASNGSMSVASVTAELRKSIQNQRNQVTQLRLFLDSMRATTSLPLPEGAVITIGLRTKDGEELKARNLDELFKNVYETAREVNDTNLMNALSKMFLPSSPSSISAHSEVRHFARRSSDRERQPSENVHKIQQPLAK